MPTLNQAKESLSFLSGKFKAQVIRAAKFIEGLEGPIRIISHYDADGITAAGIMSIALRRKSKLFHISMVTSLGKSEIEELGKEDYELIIFMDMGSGQLDAIQKLNKNIIILDHHTRQSKSKLKDNILELNCHRFGINGTSEASASTLAFLTAIALDDQNWDIVDLAMAGLIGDKQHLEGLEGINVELAKEAEARGFIKSERGLSLFGKTVSEGIRNSINPFMIGLSGDDENTKKFLISIRIDPDINLDDMDKVSTNKLGSLLILKLLNQGVRPEIAEELLSIRYRSIQRKMDIEDLSHIVNSCGRMDRQSVGLAVCCGDRSALNEALKIRAEYKSEIRKGMIKLAESKIDQKKAIQFFYADKPAFASTFAGLGMQFIFDQNRPLLALTKEKNEIKVSGRGTLYLVKKGLNLAKAFHDAATKLDGVGGGHPVASGATIPLDKEQEFLNEVDGIVGSQLKIK
jgi:RecJ-like exonuclease